MSETIELQRPTGFAVAQSVLSWAAFASACVLAGAWRPTGAAPVAVGPLEGPDYVAAGLAAGGVTALVLLAVALLRRRHPWQVVFHADHVEVPRSATDPYRVRIPYASIRCVVWSAPYWSTRLTIETRSGTQRALRAGAFRRPDDAERLVRSLEDRIGAGEGGRARLAALRRLDAVARAAAGRRAPVTLACVTAVLAVWLAQAAAGASGDWVENVLRGATSWWMIEAGDWYRLVTGSLLHVGWVHALGNVFGLLVLGRTTEQLIGSWRTAFVLLAAGVGTGAGATLLSDVAVVGASGMVFGLIGAQIALSLLRGADLPPPHRVAPPMLIAFAAAMVLIEQIPFVSTIAHLSGAATGALAGVLVAGRLDLSRRERPAGRWLRAAVAGLAAVYLVGSGVGLYAARTTRSARLWRITALASLTERGTGLAFELPAELLAVAPDLRREDVADLRATAETRARERGGESARVAALLAYRLGELESALAHQRVAAVGEPVDQDLRILGALEDAAQQAALSVAPPVEQTRLSLDDRGLQISLPASLHHGFVLDALVRAGDGSRALLRVVAGPGHGRIVRGVEVPAFGAGTTGDLSASPRSIASIAPDARGRPHHGAVRVRLVPFAPATRSLGEPLSGARGSAAASPPDSR